MEISPVAIPPSLPGLSLNAPADKARSSESSAGPSEAGATGDELTKDQEKQVQQLKKRDAEVRAHEQAHAAVGGSYAGAPKYTYTNGPDGKKYATGGEVEIDVSPEKTPEATVRKMEVVIRAALAPAEPSSQDQAVARQAQSTKQQAQAELAKQQTEELEEGPPSAGVGEDASGNLTGSQSEDGEPTDAANAIAFEAAAQAYAAAAQLFAG